MAETETNLPVAVLKMEEEEFTLTATLKPLAEGEIPWLQFANFSQPLQNGQIGDHGQLVQYIAEVECKLSIELVSVVNALVPTLERRLVITTLAQVRSLASLLQFLHVNAHQVHCQLAVLTPILEVSVKRIFNRTVLLS